MSQQYYAGDIFEYDRAMSPDDPCLMQLCLISETDQHTSGHWRFILLGSGRTWGVPVFVESVGKYTERPKPISKKDFKTLCKGFEDFKLVKVSWNRKK